MEKIKITQRLMFLGLLMVGLGIVGFIYYPDERNQIEWISMWLLSLTSTGIAAVIALSIIDIFLREEARKTEILRRKTDFTISLYNRFQSEDMVRSRNVTKLICNEYPSRGNISFEKLAEQMFGPQSSPEEKNSWISFSSLIHFYSQMGILARIDLIDTEVARQLFYKYFDYLFTDQFIISMIDVTKSSGEPAFWLENVEYLRNLWKK